MYISRSILIFLSSLLFFSQKGHDRLMVPPLPIEFAGTNVDVILQSEGSSWSLDAPFGFALLFSDGEGVVYAYCIGECSVIGQVHRDQPISIDLDHGTVQAHQLATLRISMIRGTIEAEEIDELHVRLEKGRLDVSSRTFAQTTIFGAQLDGDIYCSGDPYLNIVKNGVQQDRLGSRDQGYVQVHHIEGDLQVYCEGALAQELLFFESR